MWNLKIKAHEQTHKHLQQKQKLTHDLREQTGVAGERGK